MLRGLASLPARCTGVRAIDFGENLLPAEGAYDVALHLDFDDADGYAAYFADPGHKEVAAYNTSVSVAELTARVDWIPGEEPPAAVRHTAAFVRSNGCEPAVGLATFARNAGGDSRAWDWILDLRFESLVEARAVLEGDAYREALAAIEPARTAAVTYLTASPVRRRRRS